MTPKCFRRVLPLRTFITSPLRTIPTVVGTPVLDNPARSFGWMFAGLASQGAAMFVVGVFAVRIETVWGKTAWFVGC